MWAFMQPDPESFMIHPKWPNVWDMVSAKSPTAWTWSWIYIVQHLYMRLDHGFIPFEHYETF